MPITIFANYHQSSACVISVEKNVKKNMLSLTTQSTLIIEQEVNAKIVLKWDKYMKNEETIVSLIINKFAV